MYSLVIVDDETELLEGLSHYFPWESIGFVVTGSFIDGRTALQYCTHNRPDVVLTDIRMPFMDGLQLLEALTALEPTPLFCVMSAYNDFEYAKRAISYGVQEYLVKPSSFDEIRETFLKIRALLDGTTVPVATHHVASEQTNHLIAQTYAIMEKRIGSCSLQNIASELSITDSYLSRLFKEKTGRNFQEVLLEKKMETARQMLASRVNYKNKEIAQALGYQDTQNFCRTFQRYWGKSPQKFKKEVLT
ncbi:MAG TPA: response regulator [Sphaerochaeta sp.]|mgnify:FL=1|nr:response regulator [Sphaerochaeta sp.]